MKRGDVLLVTPHGDYGKPRPAVLVQTDRLNKAHASMIVALFTTDITEASFFRLTIEPEKYNGLEDTSQIMIDKLAAIPLKRVKKKIGRLTEEQLDDLDISLALVLGLAG